MGRIVAGRAKAEPELKEQVGQAEPRVIVASIDTYLRYADALGLSPRQATGTLGAGGSSLETATSRARITTQDR